MSNAARIIELEDEIRNTKKNKATETHLGVLKAKLSKLKKEQLENMTKGSGGGMEGFEVGKTGDARIGLIGFPSVGKSTLLSKVTGSYSKVAEYEFTTLTCVPGVFHYKGAKLQLLDLPGIIEGARYNAGKGKQVMAVLRTCSLILMILDATKPLMHKKILEEELEGFNIRLNKNPPKIKITKKEKGGIEIFSNVKLTKINEETIKSILKEYRQINVQVIIDEDIDDENLIDVLEGNRKFIPCLYVLNKCDAISFEELQILDKIPHYVPISAMLEWNIDGLYETIWDYLNLIRIYTKPKGQIPNYDEPVIINRKRSKVMDFCNKIHKEILNELKYAYVWGTSTKHNPQKVGKEHQLFDEDIIQIIKK